MSATPPVQETGYWILQADGKRYAFTESLRPGDRVDYTIKRYADRVRVGDLVYCLQTGAEAALIGWGRVVAEPYVDSEAPTTGLTTYRLPVRYEVRFGEPVSRQLMRDAGLGTPVLVKGQQGAIHLIDAEEVERLNGLIAEMANVPPPPSLASDSATPTEPGLLKPLLDQRAFHVHYIDDPSDPTVDALANRESIRLFFPGTTRVGDLILITCGKALAAKFDEKEDLLLGMAVVADVNAPTPAKGTDSATVLTSILLSEPLLFGENTTALGLQPFLQSIAHPDGDTLYLDQATLPSHLGIAIIDAIVTRFPDLTHHLIRLLGNTTPGRVEAYAQSFANDSAHGEDLLAIEGEVAALAEILTFRHMEPPLAIGVLGGWGGGKTFVMRLMHRTIMRNRSQAVDPQQAWHKPAPDRPAGSDVPLHVGHVYPIWFDAWTYAKQDLWASLMQSIFHGLGQQLEVEEAVARGMIGHLANEERRRGEHPSEDDLARLCSATEGRAYVDIIQRCMPDGRSLPEASLIEQAVRDQQEAGTSALPDEAAAQHGGQHGDQLIWDRLTARHAETIEDLQRKRRELDQTDQALESFRLRQLALVDQALDIAAAGVVWQELGRTIQDEICRHLPSWDRATSTQTDDEARRLAEHIDPETSRGQELLDYLARPPATNAGFLHQHQQLLIGAGIILVVFLLALPKFPLGTLIGVLTTVATILTTLVTWIHRMQHFHQRLSERVAKRRSALLDWRDILLQQRLDTVSSSEAEATERKQADLRSEIAELERIAGVTGRYANLGELIEQRIAEAGYRDQLGLMHRVQEDLRLLSDALVDDSEMLRRWFPRGPARIVLFIDDLDRCPPDRVVAVMEAVQLLVKTRLFVVVVAVDLRYVTRALEEHYRGVLTHDGEPSGLDYIEKIFQLVYAVRPVPPAALPHFMHKLLNTEPPETTANDAEVAPRGGAGQAPDSRQTQKPTAGPLAPDRPQEGSAGHRRDEPPPIRREELTFTTAETAVLSNQLAAVTLSPRALKRVLNIAKWMKILWWRSGDQAPDPDLRAISFGLLVLASAHPRPMRVILDRLRQRETTGNLQRTLVEALDQLDEHTGLREAERREISAVFGLLPPGPSADPQTLRHLRLVSSATFAVDLGRGTAS